MRRNSSENPIKYSSNIAQVQKLMAEGKRIDGRKLEEFRPIKISNLGSDLSPVYEVSLGNTISITGVKFDTQVPYPDSPEKGCLTTTVGFSLSANSSIVPGPPCEESILYGRVVDRCIRETSNLDLGDLCITPGIEVWNMYVDGQSICDDGNIIDSICIGAYLCLRKFYLIKNEREETEEEPRSIENGLTMTWCKIGDKLFVDPTQEEWEAAQSAYIATVNKDGVSGASQLWAPKYPHTFTLEDLKYVWKKSKILYENLVKEIENGISK